MKHVDAALHTRGKSQYVDDIPPPIDMLFAAVFSSPCAHGNIQKLNFREAQKMDGVEAILTASDIPGENQIGPIIEDEPLLTQNHVRYVGQPIAVVIARSSKIAIHAVHKIDIEIEELPVILDPLEAFDKGEIIGVPRHFNMGDVESAWAACDIILEDRCEIGGQEHAYLETQRARALPGEDNCIRIFSSTQSPYAIQRMASRVLGIQQHKVEVEVKRIGGGFGGKEDQASPWACMAALGAWHTQKPIEMVLSRTNDFRMTGKRHPYTSDFKIGATREGKILAYEVKHYQNSGAVADLSPAVLQRTMYHSANAYFIPNVHVFGVCCRTNLPPNTAFRGFGGPQGMFVVESALCKVAEKLRCPKEKIQTLNLITENDMFLYGQRAENPQAKRTWEDASTSYGLPQIKSTIDDFNKSHFEFKKGYAVMPVCFGIAFTTLFMNQASALVHVYRDGSVSVTTGGIEMGQGISTKIVYIVAKEFGIDPGRIKVESTNTTRIANMSPSAASSTTDLNGRATIQAVHQILAGLKKVASTQLGVDREDQIMIIGEKVYLNGDETELDWPHLIQSAYLSRTALSSHAFYATPNIYFDERRGKGRPFAYHVFGTAIVEVTVDSLRGMYDIDSVKIVHDLGRPINALIERGQIEGGLAQGLGWMTIEDLQYDEGGKLRSDSLATYKVPDSYFMPDDIQIKLLENVAPPAGPYGSKGVGEPPFMYGIGAFFAIRYAMKAFGKSSKFSFRAPLTPERVLTELSKAMSLKNKAPKVRA